VGSASHDGEDEGEEMSKKSSRRASAIKSFELISGGTCITFDKKRVGKKTHYHFSNISNGRSPMEFFKNQIQFKIDSALKNSEVKKIDVRDKKADQLNGEDLLRFKARVCIRKYKYTNQFMKNMSKIPKLTKNQVDAVLRICEQNEESK